MKRVIRASREIGPNVSILDFEGMSVKEIDQYLEDLPVGARITDVCTKPDRFHMDTIIEKKAAYKSNYHNPVGSPNDFKYQDTYWAIAGYEDPYFGGKVILSILDGTYKYYQVSPRASDI